METPATTLEQPELKKMHGACLHIPPKHLSYADGYRYRMEQRFGEGGLDFLRHTPDIDRSNHT